MKKLFLIPVLTLIFTLNCFSQITKLERETPLKETKVAPMGTYWASMEIYKDKSTLTFKDAEYQYLNEYTSIDLDHKTANDLFDLLTKKDSKEDDSYLIKTLDKEKKVYVEHMKFMGKVGPILYVYENEFDTKPSRMPTMSKRQLEKLFNKR